MHVHLCITTFLIVSCATISHGRPVPGSDPAIDITAREPLPAVIRRDGVGFEGNPDLYGLGIRIGIYCQLVSSLLANHYHREIMQDAWDTNTIFLVAVFGGVVRASLVGQLEAIEAYIMLQMLFAFLLSVFHVSKSYGWTFMDQIREGFGQGFPSELVALIKAHKKYSGLGTLARTCLRTAIASYNVWFWFAGVDSLSKQPEFSPQIFLFARIRLDSAKTFFQILAVLYLYFLGGSIRHVSDVILYIRKLRKKRTVAAKVINQHPKGAWEQLNFTWKRLCSFLWKYYLSASIPSENKDEVEKDGKGPMPIKISRMRFIELFAYTLRFLIIMTGFSFIVWSALSIELTLLWSAITNVYGITSVGQLIPLIIGLVGLLRTIHLIVIDQASISRKSRVEGRKSSIKLDKSSGFWKYCLRDGKTATFHGSEMKTRRWSFDMDLATQLQTNSDRQPPPRCLAGDDPLPPTSTLELRSSSEYRGSEWNSLFSQSSTESATPFRKSLAKVGLLFTGRKPVTNHTPKLVGIGEWRIPLASGDVQVFGDFQLNRRNSFSDDRDFGDYSESLPFMPHLTKPSAKVTNKTKTSRDHVLEMRKRRGDLGLARERNEIPHRVPNTAEWHYRLRDGRTQTFLFNSDANWKRGGRRWSTESAPGGFRPGTRVPEAYLESEGGPADEHENESRFLENLVRLSKHFFGVALLVFFWVLIFSLLPFIILIRACFSTLNEDEEVEVGIPAGGT